MRWKLDHAVDRRVVADVHELLARMHEAAGKRDRSLAGTKPRWRRSDNLEEYIARLRAARPEEITPSWRTS